MRFSGRDANRIAAGRKTEHRTPRTDGRLPFEPGHTFPVTVMMSNPDLGYSRRNPSRPRKEGHTVCHVRMLEVRAGLLHEAGELGARAEGHNGFEELVNTWWGRYKTGCGLPGSPEFPIEIPVWVLRFELDASHRPRLLAKASDVNRGYTESPVAAVDAEPEGVEDIFLDRFSREGAQDTVARLAAHERRILERPLQDQLQDALIEARRVGVDTKRHEDAILKRIEALRARTRRDAA